MCSDLEVKQNKEMNRWLQLKKRAHLRWEAWACDGNDLRAVMSQGRGINSGNGKKGMYSGSAQRVAPTGLDDQREDDGPFPGFWLGQMIVDGTFASY